MADVSTATRYIAVAAPSKRTDDEWKDKDPNYVPKPPIHEDYALMKVLYMLRIIGIKKNYPVNVFNYADPPFTLDFSGLQDSDAIFIVAHGDNNGIYAMGPNADKGGDRLVEVLTDDGNLKAKRKGKEIIIALLSCRAGLGLYKGLARRLTNKLGQNVTVGGPLGFTFGSMRTNASGLNEVLIQGLPWFIDYPQVYKHDPTQAEKETSAREGKTITFEGKKKEIEEFIKQKTRIEDAFKAIIKKLKSKDVNNALDELDKNFGTQWKGLIRTQYELYYPAKKESNLEFDMWYPYSPDAYVWTTGKKTKDAEATAILKGDLTLTDLGATSIK